MLFRSPINTIPAAIVENQSVNIEVVSGATNTSNAILNAVKAALKEAGLNPDNYMNAANASTTKLEDATYDVIVLGGGGAGLSAAIEAKAAGKNVVLVEKMSYCGGNTLLSYAELACPNNWLQKAQGIEDSVDKFATEMWEIGRAHV